MLIFAADRFVKARESLATLERMLALVEAAHGQKLVSLSGKPAVLPELDELEKHVTGLGLPVSIKAIKALRTVTDSGKSVSELQLQLFHLTESVHAELEAVLLLQVPVAKREFFEKKNLFGDEVANAFASASVDIEEAGKCFALERYTACVFHLMHVMEIGLRVLAATLNDPRLDPKKNPSWERILRRCREELEKKRENRAPEWAADDAFFSQATATLMAVKDAWRNPTMHVEINYTENQAEDVFNHVKAFMRLLATKLHD